MFSPFNTLSLEWTEWAPWSSCSQSCGGGSRSRERNCTSHDGAISPLAAASGPLADHLGNSGSNFQVLPTTCHGEREQLESCGEDSCPGEAQVGRSTTISHFSVLLCPVTGNTSTGCRCGMRSSRQRSADSASEVLVAMHCNADVSSRHKVTSEQAWIGKLQLSNGDFYVQDCGATLVSAYTQLSSGFSSWPG